MRVRHIHVTSVCLRIMEHLNRAIDFFLFLRSSSDDNKYLYDKKNAMKSLTSVGSIWLSQVHVIRMCEM